MSELGTNVQTEKLQHMLDCKNGKHDVIYTQKTFWNNHHYYTYGKCAHCEKFFYTKDGKVISRDEFYVAYDEQRKTYD